MRKLHIVFHGVCTNSHSHKQWAKSTSSPSLVISCFFDNSHSNRCEVISHYDFLSFIFLIMTLSIFSCTSWSPVWLLFKKIYSQLCPYFNWNIFVCPVCFFLLLSWMSSLYILAIILLSDIFAHIYLHIYGRLCVHSVDGFLWGVEVF